VAKHPDDGEPVVGALLVELEVPIEELDVLEAAEVVAEDVVAEDEEDALGQTLQVVVVTVALMPEGTV